MAPAFLSHVTLWIFDFDNIGLWIVGKKRVKEQNEALPCLRASIFPVGLCCLFFQEWCILMRLNARPTGKSAVCTRKYFGS